MKGFQLSEFNNGEFNINKAEIIDNKLKLFISYGGGCGDVQLKIFVDKAIDLKNASIITLYPQFLDGDFC